MALLTAPVDSHAARRPAVFRPEIEGLRAVAVLLVIADHLISQPRGGFVGVDVFFVISGFLITGLLIKEWRQDHRISIKKFYQRRARRILPAGLLVLALTLAAARILYLRSRFDETASDIGWSAIFLANVHFAAIGTDYFQADRPPSPVQHFWSLSVEEQFYLVWPVLLICLLALGSRMSAPTAKRFLTTIFVLITVGLFVLSWWLTVQNRDTAYFETPARAWELSVGALLALLLPRSGIPVLLARVAMPLGLVMIAASAVLVGDGPGFPAPLAALPVLGAALIIVGGSSTRLSVSSVVLTNPVSRYIGRISYVLYLVHFPVIIIVGSVLAAGSWPYFGVALMLVAGLSIGCHELVENPLRKFDYLGLVRRLTARSHAPAHRGYRPANGRRRRALVVLLACAVGALVIGVLKPYEPVRVFAAATPTLSDQSSAPAPPFGQVTPPDRTTQAILAALNSQTFPALHPSLSDLPGDKVPEWGPCGNVDATKLSACTFPAETSSKISKPKRVVVLGDSLAITWLPAIRGLQAHGYTIYAMTYGQCPAADVTVNPDVGADADFARRCDSHRSWALGQIDKLKPDIVVLANSAATVDRLADGAQGAAAIDEWSRGMAKTVATVRKSGVHKVVLMASPPQAKNMQACASSTAATPAGCIGSIQATWYQVADAERKVMQSAGQVYLDLHLFFCSSDGYCPGFIGTNIPLVDGTHIADNYAQALRPVVTSLIIGKS